MSAMVLIHKAWFFLPAYRHAQAHRADAKSQVSSVIPAPVQQLSGYAEDKSVTNAAKKFLRE